MLLEGNNPTATSGENRTTFIAFPIARSGSASYSQGITLMFNPFPAGNAIRAVPEVIPDEEIVTLDPVVLQTAGAHFADTGTAVWVK